MLQVADARNSLDPDLQFWYGQRFDGDGPYQGEDATKEGCLLGLGTSPKRIKQGSLCACHLWCTV